jgi:subtilisin family serine protease
LAAAGWHAGKEPGDVFSQIAMHLNIRVRPLIALASLVGIVSCSEMPLPTGASPEGAAHSLARGPVSLENRYIVVLRPGNNPDAEVRRVAAQGGEVHHVYRRIFPGFSATLPGAALEGLARNPNVLAIEADRPVEKDGEVLSPPWHLDRIDQRTLPRDAKYVFDATGEGVTVYIIDSGIAYSHAEFEGRASLGVDIIGDQAGADCDGHGTAVAALAAGKTYGAAPGAALKSVRVLRCDGLGAVSGILAGMEWVSLNAVTPSVVNMSLSTTFSTAMNTAATAIVNAGVTMTVSAGNLNSDACNRSPASAPRVITVGASSSADARASYSNWGACLDLFGTGHRVRSARYVEGSDTTTAVWDGTSAAAPLVAGAAALLLERYPTLNGDQVHDSIKARSTKGIITDALSANADLLYTMPMPVPPAPTGLSAQIGENGVLLGWTLPSGTLTGVVVERRVGTGAWSAIATLGSAATSHTDTDGVTPGESYRYRVRAQNVNGASQASAEASVTAPVSAPPEAPDQMSAQVTGGTVQLSWRDRSDDETGFHLQRRTGSGAWTDLATLAAGSTSYSDAATQAGASYGYRVRSTGQGGHSDWSAEATAYVPIPAPTAPDQMSAQFTEGAVQLSWRDRSDDETGFHLQRRTGSGAWADLATLAAGSTSYSDTATQAGTSYGYRVRSTGQDGNSDWSAEATAYVPIPAPTAPDQVSAQFTEGSVQLSWRDRSANETGFQVQRRTGSGAWTALATLPAGSTAYTDSGVLPGESYGYHVRATGPDENSAFSAEATVSVPPLPAAPGELTAAIQRQAVVLGWSDLSDNETGFRIERRAGAGAWTVIATLPADSTAHRDSDVQKGIVYAYRVFATGPSGRSEASNEVSISFGSTDNSAGGGGRKK